MPAWISCTGRKSGSDAWFWILLHVLPGVSGQALSTAVVDSFVRYEKIEVKLIVLRNREAIKMGFKAGVHGWRDPIHRESRVDGTPGSPDSPRTSRSSQA